MFKEIEDDITPVIEAMGCKLVEFAGNLNRKTLFVTLYVYKESGIGSEDCERIILALRPRIETLIHPQDLSLSVSSPGVNRVLKSTKEYPLFVGKKMRIVLHGGHTTEDILQEANAKEIKIGGHTYVYEDIAKGKLLS